MNKNILRFSLALAVVALSVGVEAKVRLPHFVTDCMVVQQQRKWQVAGYADGKEVKVKSSWDGKISVVPVGEDGAFSVELHVPEAGGPYTLTFDDGHETVLHDIYSGEVWLCSGQSNMEMPVGGWGKVMNHEQEIANACHPEVRFLQIKKQVGFSPASDTEVTMGGWRTCTPETVENFSSIAYFYAREMSRRLGVHVGVIDCTWGGTPAEAWSSFDGVASVDGFENEVRMLADNKFDKDGIKADYERQISEWMSLALSADEKNVTAVSETAFQDGNLLFLDDEELPIMPVPCQWEKSKLPDFNGIVYMQHSIDIPEEWAGKPLELHLGMIDDEDVTYFNGVKVAEGSGYNVKRVYTVPAGLVKSGKAYITVRVTDFEGEGGIYGDGDDLVVCQDGARLSLVGDWRYKVVADFSKLPRKPVSPESSSFPTVLYNAMLYPLHTLPVKGVLWYQGCANVGRAEQYSRLFKRLITDWRRLWNDDDLPFYFVQLAAYLKPQSVQPMSEWAALRQAQADALSLENTAMAVTIDIGDPNDIHPKNKQEVARRLSLIALRNSYGYKDIVADAPVPVSCKFNGNEAVVRFNGNITAEGALRGFIVRMSGGDWVQAQAVINDGGEAVVKAKGRIEGLKYNWADYPDGNLRGETGLPVAQFSFGK